MNVEFLILIAFFTAVFGIVYIIIQARNRERLAMIEKGYDASLLESGRAHTGKYTSLKWGIAAVGIAMGLLAGNILAMTTNFGRIGLIIYYLLVRKKGSNKFHDRTPCTK